jgi:hypothetical protein
MVVYTSAAPEDNPELVEAHRRGLPTIKRAQMVARLMEGKRAVAVAGTHGKTTTSSLIAYMLWRAGRSPTFMVGGEMLNLETNALPGEGPDFVVEADEFDAAFLNYHPDIALVTSIRRITWTSGSPRAPECVPAVPLPINQTLHRGAGPCAGHAPGTVGSDVKLPVVVSAVSTLRWR